MHVFKYVSFFSAYAGQIQKYGIELPVGEINPVW